MGTVYLAERADGQFDQQVAIKLVRSDAISSGRSERFVAERQILARLDHPHIAKLLDGGVSDDGNPFLVMELVDGDTLLRYCDARQLTVDERLRLFCEVLSAVSYAHRNLVVHRDLKPSNIFVTKDGRVKLLDFGIAKIVSASEPAPTATGSLAMTPEYAAPEQFSGDAITTATDIYGLGAVLYELLTGSRPLTLAGLSPAAAETKVSSEVPVLASRAIADDDAESVASERASTPARLRRRIAGDLEMICAMALRKEPERRYASVEQLGHDLDRHIEGRPVVARPDRFRYRLVKFVTRHRVGVAAAGGMAALVIAFSAFTALQSARIARERDKAQEVTELLVQAFEIYDPSEESVPPRYADEALRRGVTLVDTELSGQPGVQADLLDALGRIYTNLGQYESATPLLDRALELRREGATSSLSMAESLDHIAELHQAKGEYDAAEALFRESVVELERQGGADALGIAEVLNHLGGALIKKGDYDEAEAVLLDALARNRASLGDRHADTAESLNNLGSLHYTRGEYDAAEDYIREAIDIRRETGGNDHPLVGDSLSNLSNTLSRAGRFDAAEEAQREALAIRSKVLGDDHPHVATSLNNLALIHFSQGDYERAEPLLRRAVVIRKAKLRADHPDAAQSLSNLGLLLQTTGRLDESEAMYRDALEIRRKAFGDDHQLIGQSLNNLGLLLQAKGDPEIAYGVLRESLDMLERLLGSSHPTVATNLNNLASVLCDLNRLEEAQSLFARSLEIRREALPAGHPHLAYSLFGLGKVSRQSGLYAAARGYLEEALEIRVAHLGSEHPLTLQVKTELSR